MFAFNLVNVIKSFEAATKLLAVILACKAVSSVVITVTLATRLASIASAFASSTLRFEFNLVNVIKSLLAEVAVINSEIAIFLVWSTLMSTIGKTSFDATSVAAKAVRSVIFTLAS